MGHIKTIPFMPWQLECFVEIKKDRKIKTYNLAKWMPKEIRKIPCNREELIILQRKLKELKIK